MVKTRKVFGIAFLICVWQILFALLLAPNGARSENSPQPEGFVAKLAAKYDRLNEWDSDHYTRIIDQGYSMPEGRAWIRDDIHSGAANVMFFPGYPLASRYFKEATGIPTRVSMLIVSQLACWIFWVYVLLILLNAGVSRRGLQVSLFLILIHPAAFYLVMGYTESTFLAALLGFIYWSDRLAEKSTGRGVIITAAQAFVMGITRIVSFAAAPYPMIAAITHRHTDLKQILASKLRNYFIPIALGAFAILGTALYFNFLNRRFGDWTLYFKLEEIGWGNHREWLAVINPLSYIPRFFFEDTRSSINRLSNLSVVMFFYYLWKQEKRRTDSIKRIGLYFTAFFLYYIPITGKAAAEMDSMVRYNFPSTILLALCLGMILSQQEAVSQPLLKNIWSNIFRDPKTQKIRWGLAFGAFVVFAIQVSNIYRFLRGGWIA
jgi:hypothetical protein